MDGIDAFIYTSYVLVFLAAAAAVILPLINSLSEPKSLMTVGIGLVGLLLIYLVGWALSGNEVTSVYTTFGVDAEGSKAIGGLLTAMYILIFVSVFGIIFSEIKSIFGR